MVRVTSNVVIGKKQKKALISAVGFKHKAQVMHIARVKRKLYEKVRN